ncbi:hypothetical protein [Aequorivita sp. KMM 9714]|uniref:hypothetical protein n=1 Tax=Aequorivita sp. KMM 9714 TaxID=2707173 RepID=UPI0013E9D9E7|nr:hypothetical protein [Aequorivita sp. KMM 9714]NGX85103.1 hypothetical protein [Aequorivita sp. KMM 9714]
MSERVKLIWDFRGPNAEHTAKHHTIHLSEFAQMENINNPIIGQEELSKMHHTAYMVVDKDLMNSLRETLKPTRGQYYDKA